MSNSVYNYYIIIKINWPDCFDNFKIRFYDIIKLFKIFSCDDKIASIIFFLK